MPNLKTKKFCVRLPQALFDMLVQLSPLYGNDLSKTLRSILESWQYSKSHQEFLDKLAVLRYEFLLRKAKIEDKLATSDGQ